MVSQSQNLQIRQSQNLVMSQAMQQSLKILQLSSIELAEFIETELQNNPLLETEVERTEDETRSLEKTTSDESDEGDGEKDSYERLTADGKNDSEREGALDNNSEDNWSVTEDGAAETYKDDFDVGSLDSYSKQGAAEDDTGTIIEKTYAKEKSLKEHLLDQINLDFHNQKNKIIAAHIIDMLDGNGYLSSETVDEDLIGLAKQLSCDLEDVTNVIKRLQKCDPTGICARNLKECLKIQLRERDTLNESIEKLIDNLELLAKGELDKLRKICGVDADELKEMIKDIKSLNPRPASEFSEEKAQTKIADLILEKKNGEWTVELNFEVLPKIMLKRDYYNRLKSNNLKSVEKKFLSENYSSANFLIRAVEQRCESMLKVGNAILHHQEKFFDKGINFLKPITMKQVAEEVELHESTVGRVVANKYMATPNGVYELKYFFSTALHSTFNDSEFSSSTAKHQIKELLENETEVLSDDDIATILKEKGIEIARRTVAKYREGMNIPTSAIRKRLKKIDS